MIGGITLSLRLSGLALLLAAALIGGCGSPGHYADKVVTHYTGHELSAERIPWYFPDPKVPPPRFPEAHPDAVYKEGMTPKQYFEHLCKLEAGEFIGRTVEGVEGIYLLRPRFEPNGLLLAQREAMEDPFSAVAWDGMWYSTFHRAYTLAARDTSEEGEYRFVSERSYKFTEKPYLEEKDVFGVRTHYKDDALFDPLLDGHRESLGGRSQYRGDEKLRRATEKHGRYLRYVRNWPIKYKRSPGGRHYAQNGYLIEHRVDSLKSRYGVAWRGISRPRDREMGIGGGELYVIDLATNEIIAYRRGFVRTRPGDRQAQWYSQTHCPLEPEFDRGYKYDPSNPPKRSGTFIQRVLIPSTSLPLPQPE